MDVEPRIALLDQAAVGLGAVELGVQFLAGVQPGARLSRRAVVARLEFRQPRLL